jgi:hypothetical protein
MTLKGWNHGTEHLLQPRKFDLILKNLRRQEEDRKEREPSTRRNSLGLPTPKPSPGSTGNSSPPAPSQPSPPQSGTRKRPAPDAQEAEETAPQRQRTDRPQPSAPQYHSVENRLPEAPPALQQPQYSVADINFGNNNNFENNNNFAGSLQQQYQQPMNADHIAFDGALVQQQQARPQPVGAPLQMGAMASVSSEMPAYGSVPMATNPPPQAEQEEVDWGGDTWIREQQEWWDSLMAENGGSV